MQFSMPEYLLSDDSSSSDDDIECTPPQNVPKWRRLSSRRIAKKFISKSQKWTMLKEQFEVYRLEILICGYLRTELDQMNVHFDINLINLSAVCMNYFDDKEEAFHELMQNISNEHILDEQTIMAKIGRFMRTSDERLIQGFISALIKGEFIKKSELRRNSYVIMQCNCDL